MIKKSNVERPKNHDESIEMGFFTRIWAFNTEIGTFIMEISISSKE